MKWKPIVILCALLCSIAAAPARAQTFTSTDIGAPGVTGSASQSGGVWTVQGSGADIWGASDSFQFAQSGVPVSGSIIARVDDLQNTYAFAKAGVMIRGSLAAGAPMAILDVKPDGGVEFMVRHDTDQAVTFIAGRTGSFPRWLRLSWEDWSVTAFISSDGDNWTQIGASYASLYGTYAGLAVTSHDNSRLAAAHFSHVELQSLEFARWTPSDVGAVGPAGSAIEHSGQWEVRGAGGDIWGGADAFQYLSRVTRGELLHLTVRVDDLQNTNAFAKAGVMLRTRLDPDAATILLDVKPGGDVEFMQRASSGGNMQFLAGAHVTLPAWLQLEWHGESDTSPTMVTASVSQDKIHWQPVGTPVPFAMSPNYNVGVAVTSHDTSQLATAHFTGLSLLPSYLDVDDVGSTGLVGNASIDRLPDSNPIVVEGAGADVWGPADSFTFVHFAPDAVGWNGLIERTMINAAHQFSKAGLMFRDGLAANAASVILDLKPEGGVEFMARMCAGCPTTFIAGTEAGLPVFLRLSRDGSTFHAEAWDAHFSNHVDLGSVTVPMATPTLGFAVTSHDTGAMALGTFDDPPM